MATSDLVAAIINDARGYASTEVGNADNYAQQAISAAQSFAGFGDLASIVINDVPNPNLVFTDVSNDVKEAFDNAFAMFSDYAKGGIRDYLASYFPSISTCLSENSDAWICDVIGNMKLGLSEDLERALYSRGRDRVIEETSRAKDTIAQAFSARGFPMPPGAMNAALMRADFEADSKLGELSRDVEIENQKMTLENVRFAVTQAVNLRTSLLSALAAFIRALIDIPNGAAQYAETIMRAKTTFWNAATAYYSATIDEERMKVQGQAADRDWAVRLATANATIFQSRVEGMVRAAVAAAGVAGDIAKSALSATNSMAQISVQE